jgi:hypothetical protein
MTLCIFTGPTVAADEARTLCKAIYLPPVRQGDVYRVAISRRPRAIAIIDGYFQQVPSVWHKEILWAMAQGIHVFGSASMGALRAAELADFGMQGVGKIFTAYRNGFLEPYRDEIFEDDDEVALIHGPPEMNYSPLSDAMVNIRCSLARACDQGVISHETRNALVSIGKSMFYAERSYDHLLKTAAQGGMAAHELDRLSNWLVEGRVDQKRQDALDLLARMQHWLNTKPAQKQVAYEFEHTDMWQRFVSTQSMEQTIGETDNAVLTELRLEGLSYYRVKGAALLRQLALQQTNHQNVSISRRELKQVSNDFRRQVGMLDRASIDHWLVDNNLDLQTFDRLMIEETRLKKLESLYASILPQSIIDHLHLSGEYSRLVARSRRKSQVLGSKSQRQWRYGDPPPYKLLIWYFETRLSQTIPDDLEGYAADLGFATMDMFYQALADEYRFVDGNITGKNK